MEKIRDFLKIHQIEFENKFRIGDGYGSRNGNGYGSGEGSGDGFGFGSGSESGSGSGDGDIIAFESLPVFNIDHILTIITSVRNNIAKGFILNSDFTKTPCFIVKENNLFAHGGTLKEAFQSLQEKLYNNFPLEERILKFKKVFKDFSLKYPASKFFSWHNILTGSCKMGRLSFAKDRDINIEKDQFTVYEFIELTKDSYNGDNIKALLK